MQTYKHLLVASDFSESASTAAQLGARLAGTLGSVVTLAHVYDSTPFRFGFSSPDELADRMREGACGELERLKSEHFAADAKVRTVALDAESTALGIAEHAKGSGVDLVIVGTRGRTTLARLLIGSVAESIVRLSPCDVLTVPPGVDASRLPRRLLAPTDFSAGATQAVDRAHGLAHAFDAELVVVHVFDPSIPVPAPNEAAGLFLPQQEVEGELRAALEQLHKTRLGKSARVSTDLVVADSHAEGIVAYAEDNAVDWIVVGSFGRGALERFLIGSVAERVVRAARCPVLTVRQKKKQ